MTEDEIREEEIEETQTDAIKWISAGFGIGLLVGGIVGLLLAPKSGKEHREHLRTFAGDLSQKTKTLTKDLGEKAKDLGEVAKTQKDALSESFKAGKSKYDELRKKDEE